MSGSSVPQGASRHPKSRILNNGLCVLHDGKWNRKVIHMRTHIWDVEITAITGLSFCDAINAIAVIAPFGIGGVF